MDIKCIVSSELLTGFRGYLRKYAKGYEIKSFARDAGHHGNHGHHAMLTIVDGYDLYPFHKVSQDWWS